MKTTNLRRIRELLRHLDALDARKTAAHEETVVTIAREAIFDELSQLARAEGLAVYRRGETLDAVSMVG